MKPYAVLVSLATLLAACVSLPERPPAADPARAWRAHSEKLSPLSTWEIRGRVALRTETEGWQASMIWVRRDERHQIDLSGPLGRGHVRLTRDAGGAMLKDSEQKVYRNSNAEELLALATGYRFPLEGLNYWVRGLPVPGGEAEREYDAWGRLARLRQLGWDIEYLEYENHAGLELPAKFFARRRPVGEALARAGEEEFEVRLVIDRWTLK